MMAYGLGRNIVLLQTSLQSFNLPPPTHKRIKQKNSLLIIKVKFVNFQKFALLLQNLIYLHTFLSMENLLEGINCDKIF